MSTLCLSHGITAVILWVTCLAQASDYEGSQVWRVFPANEVQARVLDSLRDEFDFWGESPGGAQDIRTEPANNATLMDVLNRYEIKSEIFIENLEPLVASERPTTGISSRTFASSQMNWNNYQSTATVNVHNSIHQWLDSMSARYPTISKVMSMGKSTENRQLKLIKIGIPNGNSRKKAYWIDGAFHAREWISPAVVTWMINEMLTNNQKYKTILKNVDFYILPILNVDGYEFSRTNQRFWRKTRSKNRNSRCIGVDPNRNFAFHWNGPGNSVSSCSEVYRGPQPFSEPETRAMRDFIAKMNSSVADWRMYNSFHSYAQVILSPWGFTKQLPPDHKELKQLGQSAAAALKRVYGTNYQVGAISELLPLGSGASDDWAKGSGFFKYSYTYELRDTGRYGFVLPPSQIIPTAQETWEGVKVMMNYASNLK